MYEYNLLLELRQRISEAKETHNGGNGKSGLHNEWGIEGKGEGKFTQHHSRSIEYMNITFCWN